MKAVKFLSFFSLMFIVSCGGGGLSSNGDDNPDVPPSPPAVFAVEVGDDRTANEQSSVTLTATATEAESATYAWSVTPALEDGAITHADNTSADASLMTPALNKAQQYTVRLTASKNGESVFDEFILTVNPVNQPPIAIAKVTPYEEDLYQENQYPGGVNIELDATGSSDPDSDQPVTYSWSQVSGTDASSSITEPEAIKTLFKAPNLNASETLTFRLTVTDNEGATSEADISMEVLADQFIIPKVDAGLDRTLYSGERFVLQAEATTTALNVTPFDYLWQAANDSEMPVQPEQTEEAKVTAVAPLVNAETKLTFQVRATDINSNYRQDKVTITVKPFSSSKVSDTGVTRWAQQLNYFTDAQADYPGQDADYGRDAFDRQYSIQKQGAGERAFDFTKINDQGDDLDDNASAWQCLRDNFTGLIWQVKTTSADIHLNSQTYTWYDTGSNNGSVEGAESVGATQCNQASCNTQSYVSAVNTQGLCGAFDWRLPTIEELYSIVHFGVNSSPLLDTNYFPNSIPSGSSGSLWYWASESAADGAADDAAQNAWALDLVTGNDNMLPKSEFHHVRLVRAGKN